MNCDVVVRRTVEGRRELYMDGGRADEVRQERWNVVGRSKNVDWALHER